MKHSIGKLNASCGGFQWKVFCFGPCSIIRTIRIFQKVLAWLISIQVSILRFQLLANHSIWVLYTSFLASESYLFDFSKLCVLDCFVSIFKLFFYVTTGLFPLFKVSTETLRLVEECFTKKTVDSVVFVGILIVRSCPFLFGIYCFSIQVSPWCKK